MSDRELLELAAKAAGIDAEWCNDESADYEAASEGLWLKGARSPDNSAYWNPLLNDSDALRLAVTLGFDIHIWNGGKGHSADCTVVIGDELGNYDLAIQEPHLSDRFAATRRAIVRAAAEIGKVKS